MLLWVLGVLGASLAPAGIARALKGSSFCSSPTLWKRWCSGIVAGGWPRSIKIWGTARVLVSGAGGASPYPSLGLGRGLRLGAGARQLSGRGGLGTVGGQRAGCYGRSVPLASRDPLSSAALPCWAAGVGAQGAGRRLGCRSRRGGFFPCLARPAYLHLCPFAGCSRLTDPDPLLSGQVKTGTILATGDNNKSLHVTVCSSATLHFPQPADTLPASGGQRPAAFLSPLAGPPCCIPKLPRSCPAPSLGMETTSSALAWGKGWGKEDGCLHFSLP